jgi:hypothetical protein
VYTAVKSIALYKDLELPYRSIIENFLKIQEDNKAARKED